MQSYVQTALIMVIGWMTFILCLINVFALLVTKNEFYIMIKNIYAIAGYGGEAETSTEIPLYEKTWLFLYIIINMKVTK